MNRLLFLLLPLLVLTLVACEDDEKIIEDTTDIQLNFTGSYGSDLLQMQQDYTYPDGRAIRFTQFNFYIGDLVLLNGIGPNAEETEVKEIDYVDLSFTESADAQAGQTISISNIPVGVYDGIKIGFGVPADLNRTKPEDYGSGHPLKSNSHYWEGWGSYIFSKIEGGADLNEDGQIIFGGSEAEGISFHSGTDEVYAEKIILREIVIEEGSTLTFKFNVDLQKLFQNTSSTYDVDNDGYLDIQDYTGTHTDAELEIAKKIMSNFSEAISLEF